MQEKFVLWALRQILSVFYINLWLKVISVSGNLRCNLHIETITVLNMNTLYQKIKVEFVLNAMDWVKVYLTLTMDFKVISDRICILRPPL